MILPLLLLAAFASAAPDKPADDDVYAYVNGVPLLRSVAKERAWKTYGLSIISAMGDEVLVRQAANVLGVAPDPAEVEARLKREQDQFKDKAAFRERLAASGSSVADLKATIENDVLREALVVKAKGVSVTDADVKEYFEANKASLALPERVRLRQLTVKTELDAADVLTALKAGADFGRLASQVSIEAVTKEKGGDRGLVARGALPPELEALVFALPPGEVAGPVRTPLGYSLYKAEEFYPAKPAVFAETREQLKQALLADRIAKAWAVYVVELRAKAVTKPGPKPEPKP